MLDEQTTTALQYCKDHKLELRNEAFNGNQAAIELWGAYLGAIGSHAGYGARQWFMDKYRAYRNTEHA